MSDRYDAERAVLRRAFAARDAVRDARSESRYEDDPRDEPTSDEVKDAAYRCTVDESAGERERRYGDA